MDAMTRCSDGDRDQDCCRWLQALKAAGVRFIVAPYEADAQMAYMAKNGIVDVVITEDSDLLTYGCPLVMFKLDKVGECSTIAIGDLANNRTPNFSGFTHTMFVEVRPRLPASAPACLWLAESDRRWGLQC